MWSLARERGKDCQYMCVWGSEQGVLGTDTERVEGDIVLANGKLRMANENLGTERWR